MKDWFYNESAQVGVDYAATEEALAYDERMERFRDYDEETRAFIDKLNLHNPKEATAIDLGCGTGAFAVHAANYLGSVHAVDVSAAMLGIARNKAKQRKINNISFHQAGFLEFSPPEPVDIINTKWALHHLPDYWKQAALLRMNKMLKPGGTLLLTDWVFAFAPNFESTMDELLKEMNTTYSGDFIQEAKVHIREEFSTFDWILRGMIARSGFEIERTNTTNPLATEYMCRKG